MNIVITANPLRDRGLECTESVRQKLTVLGYPVTVAMPEGLEEFFPADFGAVPIHQCAKDADLFICMGGDGTILHASKLTGSDNVPILGVNMGSKGFMAGLEKSQLALFDDFTPEKLKCDKRIMLDVTLCRKRKPLYSFTALNDAVITKGAISKIIKMDIFVDGSRIMHFPGDGVIICTPTGSTAYSLSAGGPIVEPEAENIIITPICAHAIYAQPRVLSGKRQVEAALATVGFDAPAYLVVDGDTPIRLLAEDTVRVTKSARYATLARLDGVDFFTNVERKLNTQHSPYSS